MIGQAAKQFVIDGAVVFDPCVLIVAVPQSILHPIVCANLPRQFLEQKPGDTILVAKLRGAKAFIEVTDDAAELVDIRLQTAPRRSCRNRLNLRIGIGQGDLHGRLDLNPIAVHVDGFEHVDGPFVARGTGQLRDQ